jgi:transcriptional regulator with XRE-family HTH domain
LPKPRPPLLGAVLRFLRFAAGWSEAELAQALDIKPDLISKYETGRKPLRRERLEELLAAMDVPSESIDACLYAHGVAFPQEFPGSPVDPSPAARRSIHRTAAGAGQQAVLATVEKLTENTRRLQAAQARQQAAELWEALSRMPPKQRRAAVEAEPKYWTWAVAERLCAESERSAAHRADRAMELAKLALRVAEFAPGPERWRYRIQGYAWAFVGNSRRVQGDLAGAEEAFSYSGRFWETGAPSDSGVLDGSRPLDLKGSLRQYQSRFEEALDLFELAQSAAKDVEAAGRILIKKASTLRQMAEYERSLIELRRANSLVEGSGDSRLTWLVRYLLTANLCDMGRYSEAEALVPALREKAVGLGNELDLMRVLWLEGRVVAGLERWEEALTTLEQVRRYFTAKQIAYDAALASLEVAVLYLESGRTGEVKTLVKEMLWIFKAQGVHKEAVAALRLFYEAAKRDEATAELAREILDYLNKARHNPGLRFQG